MVPPGATFRVGSFCDELYLCAPDAAAAAEVAWVTPAFVCAPESAVGALACGAGQWRCAWRSSTGGGMMVNADAYAAVCRALTLPTAPRAGMCLVFV